MARLLEYLPCPIAVLAVWDGWLAAMTAGWIKAHRKKVTKSRVIQGLHI